MYRSPILLYLLISTAQAFELNKVHTNESFLQCKLKEVTYKEVSKLQPWIQTTITPNKDQLESNKLDEVYDALQLSKCNVSRISSPLKGKEKHILEREYVFSNSTIMSNFRKLNARYKSDSTSIYVTPAINDSIQQDGSIKNPFQSMHDAILKARTYKNKTIRIILRNGIHYLNSTLELHRDDDNDDSNVTLMSHPGEFAWISGGILMDNLSWEPVIQKNNVKIYKTLLSKEFPNDISAMFDVDHTRYTLARTPNMNIEREMWGIGYQNHSFYSDTVLSWNLPSTKQPSPEYMFIDLNSSNPTGYVKNNSCMKGYNTFTTGAGGSCSSIWDVADSINGSKSTSYWCSPNSAGGWAEVDSYSSTEGIPQIPNGMTWNMTHPDLKFLNKADANAVLHAWHSQTWAVHMFQVQSINNGTMTFKPGSGSQGARNWCRCNQCYYAGALWTNSGRKNNWCRDENDTRLIGGSWFIEGLYSSLDYPNEFYFNATSRELFIALNQTDSPPTSLVIPKLKELVSVSSFSHEKPIANVLIHNIGFRDTVSTYKEKWEVPSGGDWSFHRSAALHIQNSTHTHIHNCTFRRLNGNAFLLSGYNRHSYLQRSTFEYIGQNAAAAWGHTTYYDGTSGLQPRYTYVQQNWFRDVGLFQKQSSAWFQAKTALSFVEGNIMFNLPRAGINVNDGFGGGNVIRFNIIFNTCRESGDHGPINTWDRMPFLTDVLYSERNDDKPMYSFDPLMNQIKYNLIIANYGAGWAVDNDDGSSFYDIYDNVFLDSNGFKMDYGGHNSSFHDNIIVTKENDVNSNCLGTGPFLPNITDSFYNNTCFVRIYEINNPIVGSLDSCNIGYFISHDNIYATASGNASFSCGEEILSVDALANNISLVGDDDRVIVLPDDRVLLQIVKDKLFEIFGSKLAKYQYTST